MFSMDNKIPDFEMTDEDLVELIDFYNSSHNNPNQTLLKSKVSTTWSLNDNDIYYMFNHTELNLSTQKINEQKIFPSYRKAISSQDPLIQKKINSLNLIPVSESIESIPNVCIAIKNEFTSWYEQELRKLGATVQSIESINAQKITHVITSEGKKIVPLTTLALANGAWRVSEEWVIECIKKQKLINPHSFGYQMSHFLFKGQKVYMDDDISKKNSKAWSFIILNSGGKISSEKDANIIILDSESDINSNKRSWTLEQLSSLFY